MMMMEKLNKRQLVMMTTSSISKSQHFQQKSVILIGLLMVSSVVSTIELKRNCKEIDLTCVDNQSKLGHLIISRYLQEVCTRMTCLLLKINLLKAMNLLTRLLMTGWALLNQSSLFIITMRTGK
jgi:hypothetical protein